MDCSLPGSSSMGFFRQDSVFLLIDFWLCRVFLAAPRLSVVAVSTVYSLAVVHRLLSHCVASLVAEHKL